MTNSIRIEGGEVVISVAGADKARLYRELAPCDCRAAKSIATEELRARFREALLEQPVHWPLRDVHGLRVALGHCHGHPAPAGHAEGLRARLSAQLAKVVR